MSLYHKTIAKDSFDYQFYKSLGFPPLDDIDMPNLILRITLGDMNLIDGLYIQIPPDAELLSIYEAIKQYVIFDNSEGLLKLKEYLSQFPNPDLIDILDILHNIYKQQIAGKVNISYHINNGESNIQPDEPVYLHQQFHVADDGVTYKLLDVVLDVNNAVDPFYLVSEEQKQEMLDDFRATFILYMMDKFGRFPDFGSEQISHILDKLSSEDDCLIYFDDADWNITHRGYDLLRSIADEAEFYIDNYDIFADIYIKGFQKVIFDTGYGDNLIIPVFLREGIDPYRAIFLIAVYLGNLDEWLDSTGDLFSEQSFRKLFSVIADSPDEEEIGTELLSHVIEEGKSRMLERSLHHDRLENIENINKRMSLL